MKKLEHFLVFSMLTFGCACLHTGCTYDEFQSVTKPCGADAHWEFNFESGALTITGNGAVEGTPYDEAMKSAITSVTISEGITSIGDSVFAGCENIKSVYWNAKNCNRTIFGPCEMVYYEDRTNPDVLGYPVESFVFGDKVELIPESLCTNMQKLKEIVIPNSVKEIGYCAFRQCRGLENVTIGDKVKKIGKRAFQNCSSLTSITIPNSVTEMGDTVFYKCSMLKSVTLGNGVSIIHNAAFRDCRKLENINLEKISIIETAAFSFCSSLTSINLQNSILIGKSAFLESGLTSVTIPFLATVYKYAFESCSELESVTIHKTLYTLNPKTFENCNNLNSIVFADDMRDISDSICYEMRALKKVTMLSDCINLIRPYAFANCDSLNTVICKTAQAPSLSSGVFQRRYNRPPYAIKDEKIENLYVPAEGVNNYKNSEWADYFENILPIEE